MPVTPLRIGVSGATGYVGAAIVRALRNAGHTIIAFVRRPGSKDRFFELGRAPDSAALADLDLFIHGAWDMHLSSAAEVSATNVEGSLCLLDAIKAAGVSRLIFISSMSAYPGCRSVYGQAKLRVEQRVVELGGIIVRPGLVYGDEPGGVTGALAALAQRVPLVPMVGRGDFVIYPCHEDDLGALLCYCCEQDRMTVSQLLTAAQPRGMLFRDVVSALAGRQVHYLPLPWKLLWLALRTVEALGMRPRLKSDSLLGLIYCDPAPDFGSLRRTGIPFRML
jgi:nucleoside-diphosphate-sugar epimerase